MILFKNLIFTIIVTLITALPSTGQKENINNLLIEYDLKPQMISYHPNGEWLISTQSSGDDKSVLVHIKPTENEARIDTLNFGYYLNISKLANDGDHLLYSFLDTLSSTRKTYKRSYKNGQFSEPEDIKANTGIPTLTYFMMNADEDIYYYTYSQEPNGLYVTTFENGAYTEPELLIPNRPNLVPFSPFFLNEKTMLLSQHGKGDNSVNGIYVSKLIEGEWKEPKKIDGLPYGWSIGIAPNDDEILYLVAKNKNVKFLNKKELLNQIDETY